MRLFALSPARLAFPSSIPSPVPDRSRRRLWSRIRSRQSPSASSFTALQTSYDVRLTAARLRDRRWSLHDLQWLFCLAIAAFALSVNAVWPLSVKIAFSALMATLLLLPVTSQFFLPFVPIATWLVLFFSCGSIPSSWRPGIWVRLLPALENIFYGVNLSNMLSARKHVVLDVLAWLPYGAIHFGAPFVCSLLMFVYAPPGTVLVFAKSFGYMNIIGVLTQLCFPCSPPWYENMYGLAPANYAMSGSPAGLARIDALTGLDMYTSSFTASPMVFGAFPSLHAGSATIEALFMSLFFPRLAPLFAIYTGWLCWATMYLSHHYAVDLVGGALLAGIVFHVARTKFLPQPQLGKTFRWDYEYADVGDDDLQSPVKATFELLPSQEPWLPRRSSLHSTPSGPSSPVDDDFHKYSSDAETLASGKASMDYDDRYSGRPSYEKTV